MSAEVAVILWIIMLGRALCFFCVRFKLESLNKCAGIKVAGTRCIQPQYVV